MLNDPPLLNPYGPPKANLDLSDSTKATLEAFPRFSTWWALLLSVVTFNFYALYWLYSRTEILNWMLPARSIPEGFKIFAVSAALLNLGASVLASLYENSAVAQAMSSLVGLVAALAFIVWVFMFRARINYSANLARGDRYWLSPVLTFVFQVPYLQYKLNRLIDGGAPVAAMRMPANALATDRTY